jgi:signal transduction histidine kinase/ActR/RegA family two-component response regulator
MLAAHLLLSGFEAIQNEVCLSQLRVARQLLEREIQELDFTTGDWADWDEMYSFAQGENREFASVQITDNTLKRLHLQRLCVYDARGSHVLTAKPAAQSDRMDHMAVFRSGKNSIETELRCRTLQDSIGGIYWTGDIACLVAARPILNGNGNGPVAGTLVMWRALELPLPDSEELAGVRLKLFPFSPDVRRVDYVAEAIDSNQAVVSYTADGRVVAECVIPEQCPGQTSLLQATMSPQLYTDGRKRSLALLVAFVVAGMAFIGMSLWMLQRSVLRRMALLNETIKRVRDDGVLTVRIPDESTDEIGQLARHFNEMLASQTQTHQDLRHVNGELTRATSEARMASSHKSRFLSSMSHELRTPLNGILGFADLLASQHFGNLNDKQSDYVTRIDRCGRHLLGLIGELLDIAKIDAGKMTFSNDSFSAEKIVQDAIDVTEQLFRNRNQTLQFKRPDSTLSATGDQDRVRQVLLNLLSNANKYTPDHGHVDISIDQLPEFIRISVQDDGDGIERSEQEKIFSEFHQADTLTERARRGTGIGLALSRRLVQAMGGHIGVRSTPGEGSLFWFTLPMSRPGEASGAPAATPPASVQRTRQLQIFVAEDNEPNRTMLCDMLEALGHSVFAFADGRQVVEAAQIHTPQLFILDIRMPVMDGLETVHALREMDQFHSTPAIALTASVGADAESLCLSAGFTAYVAKPVQMAPLAAAIERVTTAEINIGTGAPFENR